MARKPRTPYTVRELEAGACVAADNQRQLRKLIKKHYPRHKLSRISTQTAPNPSAGFAGIYCIKLKRKGR